MCWTCQKLPLEKMIQGVISSSFSILKNHSKCRGDFFVHLASQSGNSLAFSMRLNPLPSSYIRRYIRKLHKVHGNKGSTQFVQNFASMLVLTYFQTKSLFSIISCHPQACPDLSLDGLKRDTQLTAEGQKQLLRQHNYKLG